MNGRVRGRDACTGQQIDVTCRAGRIEHVTSAGVDPVDREAAWLAPGLFDIQVNGGGGHGFNTGNPGALESVVKINASHGVTGLLPTVITDSPEALRQAFLSLTAARDADAALASSVPGYQLEGPWISPEDGYRGAHPRLHCRIPDWDLFLSCQAAARGLIRIVTLAPELPEALAFIEKLVKSGVVVAIGHTAADANCIADAVRAGARLSTHLGNGIATMLPRHANPIWEQLARDDLWASVIADGHHLSGAVLSTILRVKTPRRTIAISDASGLAGLPPGRYREWGGDVEVHANGRIEVAGTPYLAGSGAFLDQCVANLVSSGVRFQDAVAMAAIRPRELLGIDVPQIKEGSKAEFLMLDDRGIIIGTAME